MEEVGVKYVINGRQGLNLIHRGHIFTKHFSKNGQTYYQCSQRQKYKYYFELFFTIVFPQINNLIKIYRCRGRIQQQECDKKVFITIGNHTHLPISKRKYTLKANSKLRNTSNMISKIGRTSKTYH